MKPSDSAYDSFIVPRDTGEPFKCTRCGSTRIEVSAVINPEDATIAVQVMCMQCSNSIEFLLGAEENG